MDKERRIPGENYIASLNGDALLEEIRALGFVKVELELFLDTHPGCQTALDYYHKTLEALRALTEKYESTVGPLTASGVTNTERWTWVDSPWPWQKGNGAVNGRGGK